MTKTLAKVSYYATERKTFEKDTPYQIDYTLMFGVESLTKIIKVKGNLNSIDNITEEEFLKWKKSLNKDDFFKEQEYKLIFQKLTQLGQKLKIIGEITKKEYILINKDIICTRYGERHLKLFEENILLKAYKNNINSQP
jgi:hypothetical protein